MSTRYDCIIVGQGIAGTVLALTLLEKGKKVLVVSDPSLSACSLVTGGSINPVVLKRLVKSWKADELIPAAFAFYRGAEHLLGKKFFRELPILKLFGTKQDAEFWRQRAKECGNIAEAGARPYEDLLRAHEGASLVSSTANVNVPLFLGAARDYLAARRLYREERFDYTKLLLRQNAVEYRGAEAEKIIFCEGWKAKENPYFSYLPFSPVKGETLTIRIQGTPGIREMLHRGVALVPLDGGLYKAGSTFAWDDLNDTPTPQAKEELVKRLDELLKVPYEIIKQEAGVRPAVKDRRPLIGWHPAHPRLGIFNGMGTKGVMLTPYFARQMATHFIEGAPIDAEVRIERFASSSNPVA